MKNQNRIQKNIVIIPFSLPWNWSADYERQTAITLAKKGYKVIVYLDTDSLFLFKGKKREYPKVNNIFFYIPVYLIPFKRFLFIEKINQFINLNYLVWKYIKDKKIILWIFHPKFYAFPKMIKRKVISLYDCVDYYESIDRRHDAEIKKNEKDLIKNSDYFFVNSKTLKKIHSKDKGKIFLVPQGFSIQDFYSPKKTYVKFFQDKPLIGFVGSLDYRLDFDLLFQIIKNRQECNFVFWGPINTDYEENYFNTSEKIKKLLSFKNVIYGKSKDRSEIPNIIKQFDIGMIPYDIKQKANKYCYPMKLFEYFYFGRPIISTPIEELKQFPKYVKIGKTVKEWEKHIFSLLSKSWSKTYQKELTKLTVANSWDKKIDRIFRLILYTKH